MLQKLKAIPSTPSEEARALVVISVGESRIRERGEQGRNIKHGKGETREQNVTDGLNIHLQDELCLVKFSRLNRKNIFMESTCEDSLDQSPVQSHENPPSEVLDASFQQGRRQKIMLLIILNMALQIFIVHSNVHNQAALVTITNFLNNVHSFKMSSHLLCSHLMGAQSRRFGGRSIWRLRRMSPFVDQVILGSHTEKEFRRRMRVNPTTFFYLCSLVAPIMQKSKKGGGIPLETRVALSLTRLGTGNYLLGCADLYGMSEGLASIVVRDFCDAVLPIIRPLVVPKWTPNRLRKVAAAFEQKHDIPFIMGAIDGSHIPIIAPSKEPVPYYNRKGFYSVLLQGIVDVDAVFWDWDCGWAGSLHDFTMFVQSNQGQKLMAGIYAPYKFIGDAAYPYRTCMWVPFKGTKETLPPDRAHWNFIQSSTRMAVERAFGMLKGRFRILLRRIEVPLHNLPQLVGACICLHNLCVIHKDFADDAMIDEAKKWLREQAIHTFGDLKQAGTMKIFDYGNTEVQRVHIDVDEVVRRNSGPDPYVTIDVDRQQSSDVSALQAGITMHRQMATLLYNRHLRRDVPLSGGFFESESSSDGE